MEAVKQDKNLQETPRGTPYVYLDSKFLDVLGWKKEMPIEIEYDFEKRSVCLHEKAEATS